MIDSCQPFSAVDFDHTERKKKVLLLGSRAHLVFLRENISILENDRLYILLFFFIDLFLFQYIYIFIFILFIY